MASSLSLVIGFVLISTEQIETKFAQVQPVPAAAAGWQRSPGQWRAVVLIHGFRPHPFHHDQVVKPGFQDWQEPGSKLVLTLGKSADVFSFAYGQNVALEKVANAPGLAHGIRRLKALGYTDIVLVGHSAGGLVARQFVEDHADTGVTKVIQVCSPNAGTSWSKASLVMPKSQELFLASLAPEVRQAWIQKRADRQVPPEIQFVCIVGTGARHGDGVVHVSSQWSADLQRQGIPALPLSTTHFLAMRSTAGAEAIAELVAKREPRWDVAKVMAARQALLHAAQGVAASR